MDLTFNTATFIHTCNFDTFAYRLIIIFDLQGVKNDYIHFWDTLFYETVYNVNNVLNSQVPRYIQKMVKVICGSIIPNISK